MTERAQNIARLIIKQLNGEITAEEAAVLADWRENNEQFQNAWDELSKSDSVAEILKQRYGYDNSRIKARLDSEFPAMASAGINKERNETPVHRVHFLRRGFFKYAAAIIILFGIGAAYFYTTQQTKNQQIVEAKPAPVKNDILPGKDRAVLTLSNGQQVILDSAASETIQDGTLSIENNDGQLIYKMGDMVAVNTMTTPKGGQYQLTLADGTKVWLNAASSITYPTAFTGNSREVTITGEAYFDVTPNPKQPFHVKTNAETITVLGTEFNVNTYENMKTSLVNGSVKIRDNMLKPGQAYTKGKISTTNIEQDIAWKNGYFSLEGKSLRELMQELARWYDIEVRYEQGAGDEELVGKIGRNLNLSQVLVGLQKMGLTIRIEENRRVVILR